MNEGIDKNDSPKLHISQANVKVESMIGKNDHNNREELLEDISNKNSHNNNEIRHWDHGTRKVVIHNIYKFIKPKDLQKMMNSWTAGTSLKITKHKKAPKASWVLVTLENDDMVEPFLNLFKDEKLKNKKGGAMSAQRSDVDNGNGNKRKNNDSRGTNENKKRSRVAPEECVKTPDQVRDALTPFWKLPYESQLEQKTKNIVNKCLSRIISEMKLKLRTLEKQRRNSQSNRKSMEVFSWLEKPIQLGKILSVPEIKEYRNKSELTFGYNHKYEAESTTCTEDPWVKKEEDAVQVKSPSTLEDTENKISNDDSSSQENAPKEVLKKRIIKTPAVGFMAAGWSGGVSEPHCLQNIPNIVCGIVDIVNKFLRDSPVPPYDSRVHQGIWRSLTIRTSDRTKECMIIICHAAPTGGVGKRDNGADDYSHIFNSEKERLTKILTSGYIPMPDRNYPASHEKLDSKKDDKPSHCGICVTSLFFQEYNGLSNPPPEHPIQHVYGKTFLEESLLQCKFQISPGAFFQVTTDGAEILYNVVVNKVKEVTENPRDTLLFDVCCGTGTIGLTCLKEGAVGKVVGIDISEPAIKDAIANFSRNEFPVTGSGTKFVASRAESVMCEEIRKVENCPIVAVVDPAREGLHQDVCRALRGERKIKRIVYVSCNPTGSLIKDAIMLCCPETKRYTGLPFKPTFAQPVDMFPLTPHCELVIVFDRMTHHERDKDSMANKDMRSEMKDDKSGCIDKMKVSQSGDVTSSQENIVTKESE